MLAAAKVPRKQPIVPPIVRTVMVCKRRRYGPPGSEMLVSMPPRDTQAALTAPIQGLRRSGAQTTTAALSPLAKASFEVFRTSCRHEPSRLERMRRFVVATPTLE